MFLQDSLRAVIRGIIALVSLLGFANSAQAVSGSTYYIATVANGGSDLNSGLDITHPVATFAHALNSLVNTETGDTIQVAAGTYQEQVSIIGKNHLTISGVGSPVLTALNNTSQGGSYNYTIVNIAGSSYITFQGFIVDGGKAGGAPDSGDECNGIVIAPYTNSGTGVVTPTYHVDINYNTVRNVGAGGIISIAHKPNNDYGSDYINIKGNKVSNANSTGSSDSSGISLLRCVNSDGDTGTHNTIQTNTVCNSYNSNPNSGDHTDGNGIIIDTTGEDGPPTLIQNNVVYNNSGRGIYAFKSSNITILNNTCYQNCRDTVLAAGRHKLSIGEIVVYSEGDPPNPPGNINVKVYNNLAVTRGVVNGLTIADYVVLRDDSNEKTYPVDASIVLSPYNSWWNGQNNLIGMTSTPTLLHLSPSFTNSASGDFSETQSPRSPTVNAGTNTVKASADILGKPRPYDPAHGGITDVGAYEAQF